MKLNPPETAPKNGITILGFFDQDYLLPATWLFGRKKWAVALAGGDEDDGFFNDHKSDESLRGWMYLPDVDDEGNVI